MKKTFLIFCILFTLISFSQSKEYKIGVNLFRTDRLKDLTEMGKTLDSIVASVTANVPVRTNGTNGNIVELVIELEVSWADTESSPGVYDFIWCKDFANLCKSKNIKWTPLLSPHYVPAYILTKYSNDKICYVDGTPIGNISPFLVFSPSSQVWDTEIANWIKAFVNSMADSGHFTTSAGSKAIDELLIGNEMMYPFNA